MEIYWGGWREPEGAEEWPEWEAPTAARGWDGLSRAGGIPGPGLAIGGTPALRRG